MASVTTTPTTPSGPQSDVKTLVEAALIFARDAKALVGVVQSNIHSKRYVQAAIDCKELAGAVISLNRMVKATIQRKGN